MSSVRTLALGAMMLVGFAGISAAQSTVPARQRADSGAYRRGREMGRRGPGRDFFADLNLTAAQKAQIKTIREKYQPQNQALRTQAKPYMDAAKAARQKGDTATARANMEKARQVMQGGQSYRTQENAEIRAILTPDQQAKFDAREKAMADRGGRGWGKKGHGNKPVK
ncbi:MAG TPA: Spy/CpxP family protein refolding chaperone [Gemmatimonadaceae bacterium]|jgi:Spy/CpxP family protein refolding chaperone